jgi:hypothetical protein
METEGGGGSVCPLPFPLPQCFFKKNTLIKLKIFKKVYLNFTLYPKKFSKIL